MNYIIKATKRIINFSRIPLIEKCSCVFAVFLVKDQSLRLAKGQRCYDESKPAVMTHVEMSAIVQDKTLFLFLRFLLLCISSNLKCSRSSGCATWTQATCQGLSTCFATSAPCESSGESCSEAMAESLLTSPDRFCFVLCLSVRHFAQL